MKTPIRFLVPMAALLLLGMARTPPEKPSKEESTMPDASELVASDVSPSGWDGAFSSIHRPLVRVVRDADSWRDLWKTAFDKDAPPVDFGKHFAVAVFAGPKNTGGYSVEFLPPRLEGGTAVLEFRVNAPSPTSFVIQSFTQPYRIQLFREVGFPVKVQEAS